MNSHQSRALHATLPSTLTGDERKSAFRRLKKDYENTPKNERAEFLSIRKQLAESFRGALKKSGL